jgi:hypothetical protein
MPRRWREPAAIAAEVERIRSLRLDALRRQWRLVVGRVPPVCLGKDLLGRMIAARLQERAFGGLDRDSLRFLENLARQQGPRRRQLKPGTVLVREYQGRRHTVTTVRDGFDWQGTTYPSLSAIARAITGTAWSGPRFFALQGAGDSSKTKRKSVVVAGVSAGLPSQAMAGDRRQPCTLQQHPTHKSEPKDSNHASLLERLPEAGPGLGSSRTARHLLERRAHRVPAAAQGEVG